MLLWPLALLLLLILALLLRLLLLMLRLLLRRMRPLWAHSGGWWLSGDAHLQALDHLHQVLVLVGAASQAGWCWGWGWGLVRANGLRAALTEEPCGAARESRSTRMSLTMSMRSLMYCCWLNGDGDCGV